ncbi:DNA-directed RNA polymerase III subunit RPC6 [Nematocida sp. LUAm3]|nr:DNA-directed RNA polymerase III subunit RPC6 [Nematocida sp. LUAm3]KAI5174875.1 DNA-directed RNA polymerase III subunit RPC6 [Nematocida sp. LUAm2]KAI5177527.1 DNA-directed RNA polymerase III subunit RPC6 [Nematocida sp. LUAm1]
MDILGFIAAKDEGVTTQEIELEFPQASLEDIVKELNTLSKEGAVDIFRTKGGIFYRQNKETQRFSTGEEKLVYLLIKNSQGEGIWIKELKAKSGLHQNLVTKIVKSLEQKMMIKSVKSLKQNRKVYMLYEEMPSDELGDGPWFTQEGELDVGFVDALKSVIFEWISTMHVKDALPLFDSLPECKDIYNFIIRSKISDIPLSLVDVRRIADILVYERKVLKLEGKYIVNQKYL